MIVKILDKIISFINKIKFKILYGNRIRFGKNVNIRGKIYIRIENKGLIIIGDNCFFNNNCSLNALDKIEIGNNTIFGENVKIYDHNHIFNKKNELIKNSGFSVEPVKIKNNCWICSDSIILKGVKIGENCVVSAGSIVKENLSDNCIYLHNSINEIRYK